MIGALLTSFLVVAAYIWQDGLVSCPDGVRYTSFRRQPYPFHRRFCCWPRDVLIVVSLASLIALGALTGSWKGSLLLLTLPGAWVIATRPTTVDAPAILLAWSASMLFAHHPWLAVLVSCASGVIHERGPVFAALYAWHPLLLVGLIGVQWWRSAAPPDDDFRVGRGFVASLMTHRQDHDWLAREQTLFAARGLPLLAAGYGVSTAAWATLAVAWCTRLVGSDLGRFVFWAGPILVRDLPDVPAWMVMAHAITFRRMA
jgi:hypothetical protein